jgi:spore coat protein U-like protein
MRRAASLAAGLVSTAVLLAPKPAPAPTTMSFGTYTSGQTSNLDADGQLTFANCPVGNLVFELDGGGTGNTTARKMTSGSNSLNYQLYRNTTRSAVFGTGSNAYTEIRLVAGGGTIPVYGRIAGNQTVSAGNYADTVNVTLTFP